MNNIHEDDWADDTWSRHSGMFVRDASVNEPDENEAPQKSENSSRQTSDNS